jgi:DNA-binding protein Fis
MHERMLRVVEPALLNVVLEHTGDNRVAAAEILGIHRATLRKKLK